MIEFEKEIINVGGSKGILIPKYFAEKANIELGDQVKIKIEKKKDG